jgi:hypothetical protein
MATRSSSLSQGGNRNSNYAAIKSQPDLISTRVDDSAFGSLATRTKSLPSAISSNPAKYAVDQAFPWSKATLNWKRLPARVLDLVLDQLKAIHLGPRSSSCTTCYMRDLASVQMTCKAWFSDAQRQLYTNIEIVGNDDPLMLQKWRLSRAARLVRLRSTLRSKHLLAALVKTIHVPDPHIPLYLPNDYPNPEYDGYLCTLASVVMSCPNLEALTGFVPFYNHTFDRLTHALSTRTKLRQHVWVIAENDDVSARSQKQLPPGLLDEHQVYQFIHYHDCWSNLETLMLCSPASLGVVEHDLFIHVLHSLPSLQNLCISSFDDDDFHDKTLLSLPAVQRFRLEECRGISEYGLTRWAASPSAFRIKELTLLHQGITALSTLSKLLASLNNLTKLRVLQSDVAPSFTHEEERVALQPTLASSSLVFLHWDILCREDEEYGQHPRSSTLSSNAIRGNRFSANAHLALSIQHDGFPRLALLRAPRDTTPYGVLQSVCLPAPDNSFLLPEDKAGLDGFHARPYSNSLQTARIRAQRMAHQAVRKQGLAQTANVSQSSLYSTNTSPDVPLNTQGPRSSPCLPPRHPLHFKSTPSDPLRHTPPQTNQASAASFKRPAFYLEPDVVGIHENGGMIGWAELLGIHEKVKMGSDSHHSSTNDICTMSEDVQSESGSEGEVPTTFDFGRESRCDGSWKRSSRIDPELENKSRIAKVLTSSSRFSAGSKSTTSSSRSKAKSSSRLALPLDFRPSARARYPERWRHFARPRGERGEAINVQNFF